MSGKKSMIRVRFVDGETEKEIVASGLGDLCWQLEVMGIDSASSDESVRILEITHDPDER